MKKMLAMLLVLMMALSFALTAGAEGKTLKDYPRAKSFNAMVTSGGITDEEFNAQTLAETIRSATGYNVKFTQLPKTDVDTTVTNIFMLQEDYQYVFCTKAQFNMLVAEGALAPLTEYVNASQNLKEVISEIGWGSATFDGEIYAIPNSDPRECTSKGFYFRLDWLKEYNEANPDAQIGIPSEENGYSMTVSNFKKMLEFFQTKVADGGKALCVEVDPASSNYTEDKPVYLQTILPAFGIYSEWADVDGKLTYILDQEGFEAYAKYMEGLFDAGLIYYQATKGDTNAVNSLMNDMAGCALVSHTKPYSLETKRAPETVAEEDYDTFVDEVYAGYISALVPDECDGDASAVRVWSKKTYNQYIVCPAFNTPEQTAAVVDYCDSKLDKDLFLRLTIGTEGETFQMKDGGYYPILPKFNDEMNLADKFLSGTREADYAEYWLARTRKTAAQGRMFGMINYNIEKTGIMDPINMIPSIDTVEENLATARNAVVESMILSIFDSSKEFSLEETRKLWDSKKGEAIEEAVNEWYATWEYKTTYNNVLPR
ncbi:MAG: hypothetical protein IKJ26_04065 [Clostridia bacterium]|nr:hypothetical protein [Clostridia bacterium]